MSSPAFTPPELVLRRHALGWLAFANLVGLWLAVLLVHPNIPSLPGGLGYGRWVPLHLHGQLYGWCALPLLGLLLAVYRRDEALPPEAWLVRAWSLVLGVSCVAWLAGQASGHPFADWRGWWRPLLPAVLLGFWLWCAHQEEGRGAEKSLRRLLRLGLLLVLLYVPVLLWRASDSRPQLSGSGTVTVSSPLTLLVAASCLLGVLAYAPRLFGFEWQMHARRWRGAALGWGGLVVLLSLLALLPPFADRVRFTEMSVGLSHLAFAGFLSCLNWAVLLTLWPRRVPGGLSYLIWQGALVLHAMSLLLAGLEEGVSPSGLYFCAVPVQAMLSIRMLSGLVMFGLSLGWLWEAWRKKERIPDEA